MTSSERRRLRRERCAAKLASRHFADEVRSARTASGVAYAVGGGLVNVSAQKARRRVLWHDGDAARTNMDDDKTALLNRWRAVV